MNTCNDEVRASDAGSPVCPGTPESMPERSVPARDDGSCDAVPTPAASPEVAKRRRWRVTLWDEI